MPPPETHFGALVSEAFRANGLGVPRTVYDFGQRIPLKTIAMKAWSEELLKSFKAAGGIHPQ